MNDDLISRRALLEAIDERERIARKYVPDIQDDELRPTLKSIREFVNNRPAVDAEPVRHGKCELCGRGKPIKAFTVLPECGLQYGTSIMARYCPNCGVRMDGEAKDDG